MNTTHNLEFLVANWEISNDFKRFKVGTCSGLWRSTPFSYDILAITNDSPGNGHLTDVFEWFEASCIRDKKQFMILEVWNTRFKKHLIEKRGFEEISTDTLMKKSLLCS